MTLHLITFALAAAFLYAFKVNRALTIAWLPRKASIAVAVSVLVLAFVVVVKDGLGADVLRVVSLAGLAALFVSYPLRQTKRNQPVKASVMLSLGVCLVFGAYLQLSAHDARDPQSSQPAAQRLATTART